MADMHIQTTIRRKIEEMEGLVEHYYRIISEAQSDLVHLRGAESILSRDAIRPVSTSYVSLRGVFKRNEAFAICQRALLDHPEGLDTRELAVVCLRSKGLDVQDKLLYRSMMQTIVQLMGVRRDSGHVTSGEKRGLTRVWKVKKP